MQEWSNRMPFEDDTKRQDGIALACSGGGFRATLFHVGTLLRLNEFGLLGKIARYSSVSGGSITCGVLAHAWQRLEFDAAGVATNFTELVATPLEDFCSTGIDVSVIGRGVLNPFKSASDYLIEAYRDKLGLDVSLQTLPDTPRFVFNSTNLASGVSFRFSKPYMGDYRIGLYHNPSIDLATAVAASSAFPPFLSPLVIKVDDPNKFIKVTGADLYDDVSYRSKLYLTDGGVYDNMGLETVWNRYSIVLVSDAGAPLGFGPDHSDDWLKTSLRVSDISIEQNRALRKRALLDGFAKTPGSGTYWGIGTDITHYLCTRILNPNSMPGKRLSEVRTRLDKFIPQEQGELINWGYLLADSAIRTWLPKLGTSPAPVAWPLPNFPLA
jgi:NTE family protein